MSADYSLPSEASYPPMNTQLPCGSKRSQIIDNMLLLCDSLCPAGPRVSLWRLAIFGIHASPPRLLWPRPRHPTEQSKSGGTETSAPRGPRASETPARRQIFSSAAAAGRGSSVRFGHGEAPSCHQGGGHSGQSHPTYAPRRPWPPLFGFRVRSLLLLFFLRPLPPLLCKASRNVGEVPGRSECFDLRSVGSPPGRSLLLHGARPPAQHRAGGDGQVRARGCGRFFVSFKLPLSPFFFPGDFAWAVGSGDSGISVVLELGVQVCVRDAS